MTNLNEVQLKRINQKMRGISSQELLVLNNIQARAIQDGNAESEHYIHYILSYQEMLHRNWELDFVFYPPDI